MIDWPIKSDVRRKCPIFSESSSESIDRNILSGTVRKSGKDDICPWQWSDFRLFRPLKTDSRLNYRTKYRTLLLISKPHSSNKTTIHVDIILYWTVLIDKYCTDSGQNDSSAGHDLFSVGHFFTGRFEAEERLFEVICANPNFSLVNIQWERKA